MKTLANNNTPNEQSSNPIIHQSPRLFTQPSTLEQIGFARIAKFLNGFQADLTVSCAALLSTINSAPLTNYFSDVAAFLAAPESLPVRLRQAMSTLETATVPQNEDQLDTLIKRHIPNVSLNRFCPLDCALELWFAAPESLNCFAGLSSSSSFSSSSSISGGPSPESSSSSSSSSSPVPVPGSTVPGSIVQSSEPSTFNLQPSTPSSSDSEMFRRLAQLSPADYDRTRKQSARQLGIRVETLDAEVTRVRNQLVEDAMLQTALATLRSPEPWPEPVNGAEVLTQIVERFLYYVILPLGAPEALTLWSAQAHCFFAFIQSPRLNLCSPEGGCGKTTALDVIARLTPRALRTENLTAPVLFRLVHQYQPTLLLDEVDAWLPQAEELRGLLNAGHKRGACAYRCEGEGNAVRPFRAFGPAVLSGIGQLTGTLHDRSIVVPLMKARADQIVHRFDDHRVEIETELCRKLARWTADNFAALKACEPPLPPTAFNRLADNWRPLFAIAQIAGGDWPELALNSFNHLAKSSSLAAPKSDVGGPSISGPAPSIQSSKFNGSSLNGSPFRYLSSELLLTKEDQQLINAVRDIFTRSGLTRISSTDLVEKIRAFQSAPASNIEQPRSGCAASSIQPFTALTPQRLAALLHPFQVHPRTLRIGRRQRKAYDLSDFIHIFAMVGATTHF